MMPAAAVVTLIGAGLLVIALAVYLVLIARNLRMAVDTLGLIIFGVRSIAHRVEPLEPLATQILDDVRSVDEALAGLAAHPAREAV